MTSQPRTGFFALATWQPQRAIAALALVVGLLLCGLVGVDLYLAYKHEYTNAAAKTDSLTQLLEEHARQSFRRVEQASRLTAEEVQARSMNANGVPADLGVSLKAFLPQDGLIASFDLLDLQGSLVASSFTADVASQPSLRDRDYYQSHQGAYQGMFVGAATQSHISGKWVIPVSTRLEGPFKGYLVATVDPEYFQKLYQSIEPGAGGFVTLFSTQGWALARWPFSAEVALRNWIGSPLFKEHLPARSFGTVRQVLAFNGVESVYSYRALSDYPVVVALGMQLDKSLSAWRKRVIYEAVGLLLVLFSLGLVTWLLNGQLRKRLIAESALQLSETSVMRSSLPTVWIAPDARFLRANQAACELHGYSEAQMLGMTVFDLNPRMTRERWPAHWERLRQQRSMSFETQHRKSDGQDVPVEAELNFIEFDGQEYNFAFFRDLTARKQTEDEIKRSESRLRGAMDAVDEAFVLFDANDTLVYCNDKYVQLYPSMRDVVVPGVKFEDLIRTGVQRGLYQDSQGREEQWIAERMHAHCEGQERRIQRRHDGRVLRVIDKRTPDGSIVGIRVDITDMVRATEAAEEASRYKSQFLANMSHEIRTPMNAILGLLSLLQQTNLTPAQRDYASKTHGAAQSLLGLLNDILDFSKVEAGKTELDPQPFRLDRLLADLSVILASNIGNKPVDVMFDIDHDVPADLLADSMRLQQVLLNLAGNAIKFTEAGQVVLRVCCVPAPEELRADQVWLQFSVADTGIGIPLDMQEHIFSGFSQAEASTTRRFGGTGLGLAISKRLIELMGGKLSLVSAPGQGSTFGFTVPLPRSTPATPPVQEALPVRQVLVVDDNPVSCEILCRALGSRGWMVESAGSGAQALTAVTLQIASAKPAWDVIYLDWQMPGMDGWETAQLVHQAYQGQPAQPRIVMLSANRRDTLSLRTVHEQGLVSDLLFKPVTAADLQDAGLGRSNSHADPRTVPRSSQRPLAGMRILVVEDNLINQQVAEELLNVEGAQVSLAANGQLGVDAVQASQPPFDVVLMDLQMPVLDGFGATRKIREELGMLDLPIVAMTANAMDSDRRACLAAGMNEHVGKPFEVQHLVSVLLRMTGKAGPAAAPHDPVASPEPAQPHRPAHHAADFASPYMNVDAALKRLAGMQSLYVKILQEFSKSLDGLEAPFRDAAAKADWPGLVGQMHSFKGAAATVGAERLSGEAARLEKMFRNPAPDLVALEHLPGLLDCLRATQSAAAAQLQALGANETRSAAAVWSPTNPEQMRTALNLLELLLGLLRQSDLSVTGRFEQEADVLQVLPQDRISALQSALQALNYPAAIAVCESEIEALQQRLG